MRGSVCKPLRTATPGEDVLHRMWPQGGVYVACLSLWHTHMVYFSYTLFLLYCIRLSHKSHNVGGSSEQAASTGYSVRPSTARCGFVCEAVCTVNASCSCKR